ncbi:MAG TPA: AAA family ATPase, partial [Kofleriaceae bacterium]|nr:AAA family ATPase [Kofleriaceae bacterium]
MKLRHLELKRFTAFEAAEFEFASGVNVLIGENGTGKSHILKLIYVLSESVRRFVSGEGLDGARRKLTLEETLTEMFQAVFQPDELHRLVRRGVGRRKARIVAGWEDKKKLHRLEVTLTSLGRLTVTGDDLPELEPSIFIPTREVLSIYPGFISSYLKRESSFDRTFYDLCVALDAKPLRGPRDDKRRALLDPLEEVLGGRVVNENGRFYLKMADGDMEAPLVAEGIRKLGMIAYLIINGSLSENGFLLWDEPEASMNPRLTRLAGHVALGLARSGIQTWIATHDYLLTSELSLAAETTRSSDTSFFALVRDPRSEGSIIESGDRQLSLT